MLFKCRRNHVGVYRRARSKLEPLLCAVKNQPSFIPPHDEAEIGLQNVIFAFCVTTEL